MGKPLPFDRNIIAVKPVNDHAAAVTVNSLPPSEKRQHQGATPRTGSHRAGLAVIEEEREPPAEQGLWLAVIARAFEDATSGLTTAGIGRANAARVRQEAINWFADNTRDFRDVCILAGLDPDAVRQGAMRAIKEAPAPQPHQPKPMPRRPASPFVRSLMGSSALSPAQKAA
jgi:hypothetical protein